MVSDKAVTRPRAGAPGYRISAWTRNAPADAGVEFELLSGGVSLETLDAVTQTGPDTFDYKWDIPNSLPDGPYTLRATLFSENEAIDHVDADITIVRLGDKAEIEYPTRGSGPWPTDGSFGTYRPLAMGLPARGVAERGKPVGNIDASHTVGTDLTSGTTRVRAFYTMSTPGTNPSWRVCGTEKTPGHPVPSSAANDGIRCTLASEDDQKHVTAVAVLANSSPGEYDAAANAAGDAIRLSRSYVQRPAGFSIVEGGGATLEANDDGSFPCHTVVAHVEDQIGREIVGANVDVHATGPSDKLRLDMGLLPHSGILLADRNHTLAEPGFDCFGENDRSSSEQSEHQILGGPDVKHAESDDFGSDDSGNWGFSFKIPDGQVNAERFTVGIVTHVDEGDDGCHANDDVLARGELFSMTSIGLGKAGAGIPQPEREGQARCPRLPALRTISLSAGRTRVPEGGAVSFYGRIRSAAACVANQFVALKRKAPDAERFRTVRSGRTKPNGRFAFRGVEVGRTFEYRAATTGTSRCVRAISRTVRVKALNR